MYSIVALYVKERFAGIEISWLLYIGGHASVSAVPFPQQQREWKRRTTRSSFYFTYRVFFVYVG
jgi:hypothetical protein